MKRYKTVRLADRETLRLSESNALLRRVAPSPPHEQDQDMKRYKTVRLADLETKRLSEPNAFSRYVATSSRRSVEKLDLLMRYFR